MKLSYFALTLAIGVLFVMPSLVLAQEGAYQADRMAARRALEMAKIELRLYEQVEYPRQRRQLDARIALIEEEIKMYKERRREYEPFTRWGTGRPLLITSQELKLCLMDAEFKLQDLVADRNALQRFHSDQWRLLALKVEEARAQVIAIEGNGNVAMTGPAAR